MKIHQITVPLGVGLCASWKDCHAGAALGRKCFHLIQIFRCVL